MPVYSEDHSAPYVFLDVNGVLDNAASSIAYGGAGSSKTPWKLDEVSVGLVRELCDRTGADLVISSAWRGEEGKMRSVLAHNGWYNAPVVGRTAFRKDPTTKRSELITRWLYHNTSVLYPGGYLIIDDESSAGTSHSRECFIETDPKRGFKIDEYREAYAKLAKQ